MSNSPKTLNVTEQHQLLDALLSRQMRIHRIIFWSIAWLAAGFVFYMVTIEERFAPEGWGF